jgi:signal transduction histidine kinase
VIEKNDKIDNESINSPEKLKNTLAGLAKQNEPIKIVLKEGDINYIFYAESQILTQLKYYPYVQFGVIGLFLLIAYILFSTARKAEQDQVWVGMSKETAHQLGTPLSSLIGWVEWLRLKEMNTEADEIEKDVKRLETITERFSKIGSQPILEKANMFEILNNSVDYMRKRTTSKIEYSLFGDKDIEAAINIQLFEWVIENLTRNAIDTIVAPGKIIIE